MVVAKQAGVRMMKEYFEIEVSKSTPQYELSKHLIDHEFIQNEYDMCTFNKMVNGEQITVQFHVDNLKVLHKKQAVLEDFLKDLRDEFGQEDKLTENKGLVYEY